MPYGGHNQYDAYDVYIDTEKGALVSFKKKGIEKEEISLRSFSQTRNPISKDKVIRIANEFLRKYNKGEIQEVSVGTAIPNKDFFRLMDGKEETEPVIISEENLEDQIIKEVYILKNEKVEVYVDLYSGEIVGGELYLYNAGAMSVSDSEIPYPKESVTDAQSGLARMGYDSVGGYFSYNYLWQFWNSPSSSKSVRQAALDAANKVPEYCPIRFFGNRSYNGFY